MWQGSANGMIDRERSAGMRSNNLNSERSRADDCQVGEAHSVEGGYGTIGDGKHGTAAGEDVAGRSG